MTILYLYQYFGTPRGGWSTRVYEMSRRWVAAGHNVIVITTPYDKSDIRASKFIERQYYEGIEVIVVNLLQSSKHILLKRTVYFLTFSVISIYYALRLKYHTVIASSGPITIGIPAVLAARLRAKVMVFEVRDLWPRGGIELGVIRNAWIKRISFWLERVCYQSSQLIVACSEGMAKDITSRFPDRNVVVVPNASDVELFKVNEKFIAPDFTQGRKVIVYAGSLGLMDDCSQIVQAAGVLSARGYNNVFIVFIGEGAERAVLEQQVRERGLRNVIFLGLMPKTEVIKWLSIAEASLVVFKDVDVLNTSSPNKFFDSLAAGVPVIQTTQGWIRDVVRQENIGINVHPDNPEEMADAIRQVCENSVLRNSMANNSLRVAVNVYNRDTLAERMLNEMQRIVDYNKFGA